MKIKNAKKIINSMVALYGLALSAQTKSVPYSAEDYLEFSQKALMDTMDMFHDTAELDGAYWTLNALYGLAMCAQNKSVSYSAEEYAKFSVKALLQALNGINKFCPDVKQGVDE